MEYERVDEEGDDYRRILAKFNPRFMRPSDFEIEFIPFLSGLENGKAFVANVDSASDLDLCRWTNRVMCLMGYSEGYERGTIISPKKNLDVAKNMLADWHDDKLELRSREMVGDVKRAFDATVKNYDEPTAYAYNHFLSCGQLASLPFGGDAFVIEDLKAAIEELDCLGFNANGEKVERPFVDILFDTHKTKYIQDNICWFLVIACGTRKEIMKSREERK